MNVYRPGQSARSVPTEDSQRRRLGFDELIQLIANDTVTLKRSWTSVKIDVWAVTLACSFLVFLVFRKNHQQAAAPLQVKSQDKKQETIQQQIHITQIPMHKSIHKIHKNTPKIYKKYIYLPKNLHKKYLEIYIKVCLKIYIKIDINIRTDKKYHTTYTVAAILKSHGLRK